MLHSHFRGTVLPPILSTRMHHATQSSPQPHAFQTTGVFLAYLLVKPVSAYNDIYRLLLELFILYYYAAVLAIESWPAARASNSKTKRRRKTKINV